MSHIVTFSRHFQLQWRINLCLKILGIPKQYTSIVRRPAMLSANSLILFKSVLGKPRSLCHYSIIWTPDVWTQENKQGLFYLLYVYWAKNSRLVSFPCKQLHFQQGVKVTVEFNSIFWKCLVMSKLRHLPFLQSN